MSDAVWQLPGWVLVAVALSPIVLGIGWVIWNNSVRPRFIPQDEIDQLADEMIARHPDNPELAAFREEHHHWYRGDDFEQGKWKRVRKEIQRRLAKSQ